MPKGISETAFASQVEDLLSLYHWRWCHWRPARTEHGWRTALSGDKGFPDYCCIRPPRLIFAELKDQYSKPTPEQQEWLDLLEGCVKMITSEPLDVKGNTASLKLLVGTPVLTIPEVYLWRPSDLESVVLILR